ncbi:hypothetical protein [Gemmatimonas sp.]|uniref:hypothetical protein n=1 Tax=Gemmatimonas sp. TaxID=1962908 RepID=UPI00333FDD67
MGVTVPGGLYYVGGVAVNAHGDVLVDAPPIGPDTVPVPVGVAVAPVAAPAGLTPEQVDALVEAKVAAKLAELTAPPAESKSK